MCLSASTTHALFANKVQSNRHASHGGIEGHAHSRTGFEVVERLLSSIREDRIGPEHIWQLSMPAIRRYHYAADELPEKTLYRPVTLSRVAAKLDAYPTANLRKNDAALLTQHVVVAGDTLTALAKHYYGDPRLANWVFQANLDTLDHADDLFIGTELRIPVAPQSTPASEGKVA